MEWGYKYDRIGIATGCKVLIHVLWAKIGLEEVWYKTCCHIECDSHETVNEVNNSDPESWLQDLELLITNLENESCESCRIEHLSKAENEAAIACSQLYGEGGIMEFDVAPASRSWYWYWYCLIAQFMLCFIMTHLLVYVSFLSFCYGETIL